MPRVDVNLPATKYEVRVKNKCILTLAESLLELGFEGKKCAVITDTNVAEHYLEQVEGLLAEGGFTMSAHIVEAGEKSKAMSEVESVSRQMIAAGHDRYSVVIALGGGVVGDLAGFVASVFYRGIDFVQIPTTIVSQVDSSVGGKCGVNTPEGKNLIGSFHQPKLVLIDPEMLKTLPNREYLEGYAEVIKHAAIGDEEIVTALEKMDLKVMPPPASLLAQNVSVKAGIVMEDEKETAGVRALLNFGHTIGHGIEASVPYGELLHGEAISLGMRAALYLSVIHAGLCPEEANRIANLLNKFELPMELPAKIETETILDKMKTDKKFAQGQIHFILLSEIGQALVSADLTMYDLEEAIEYIRTPFEEFSAPIELEEDKAGVASIVCFVGGKVATNGYLHYTGTDYIAVDAPEGFFDFIEGRGVEVKALLLTHQHYDHVEDLHKFEKAGIPIYSYEDYSKDLVMADLATQWGFEIEVEPYKVTHKVKGRDIIKVGANTICVIHVPGHSMDSVVYYFSGKQYLFAGDTLFRGGVGRSDLPNGDGELLVDGIANNLLSLNKNIQVFPGHGNETTIGRERDNNPFFGHLEISTSCNISNEYPSD